ncbi:CsgG/HfaB family protein [Helicobacter sp.]|uniref:CsgG/HfaB family protein n=1 Tax=Helicobacter sp. TaxID=218 RepID=UPI0019C3453A|nr:CsgG/HfaB family protein [Helicobacter sp.]MBD5165397.1 hypothetical protein [Helicobacter sp.]
MKKILSILAIVLSLALILQARVVSSTTTKSSVGEGSGITREEAINNALIEAIGKMNGVSINSTKHSLATASTDSSGSQIRDYYEEQISKATKGKADTYEVNSVEQGNDGKYIANVTIFKTTTTKKYQAPGLNASNRRSIVIFNATADSAKKSIGDVLQQHIITNLLQSRKFNVLDRDTKGYYDMEKALIQSGDAASDEVYKLKNVLATDYILLFSLSGLDGEVKKSNLTGKEKIQAEAIVDYRVLLFATRQIKFSNTLNMKVNFKDGSLGATEAGLSQIANRIASDILNAIYPLKVASVENNEVIFSQTLNQGDVYECFSLGKVISDSYTKENTGRIETKSGMIEIVRSTPKISYAKITEGVVKKDDICRPLSAGNGSDSQGRGANYQVNPNGGVNLGF